MTGSGNLRPHPVIAAAMGAVFAIFTAGASQAAVQCVGPNGKVPAGQAKKLGCAALFAHIGDAVTQAQPGDTVAVFPGTYAEMVTIDKAGLQLLGQNTKTTVIDATGQTNGVLDGASNVTVSGFTIKNANHEGILVTGPAAICDGDTPPDCHPAADPIANVTIANNMLTGNDKQLVIGQASLSCAGVPDFEQDDCGEAVHLDGVNFSTVLNNTVKGNAGGILLTDETNNNLGNLVNGNDVEDNTPDCGITLPSHPPNGDHTNIGSHSFGVSGNTVSNNTSNGNGAAGVGIFTPTPGTSSQKNLVIGNTITNNHEPGVVFHSHAPEQRLNDNAIISNNISGNGADPNPNGPNSGDGPVDPTGIEIYANASADPVFVNVTGNTINKETNDIWVGATGWNNCGDTAPCYGIAAELNNLLGKNTGINNAGNAAAVFVIAPQNYWGCPKGPGQKGCSTAEGNVSVSPFLGKTAKIQ